MIKTIIITTLLTYIFFGMFLYYTQDKIIFHPTKITDHKEKEFFIKNKNEDIQIISINEDKEKAIIYFGGNAENIINSIDYIKRQFPNYAIYMMNYRGYGKSSGEPTEEGIYSDSLKLYDLIHKTHKKIYIGGRSLGSTVAAYVAAKRNVIKVALITPFTSIEDIAQDKYKIYPANILLKYKFNTENRIKDIKANIGVFIADNDGLIPEKITEKFLNALPKDSKRFIIKNTNHITISESEDYFKKMQNFIND